MCSVLKVTYEYHLTVCVHKSQDSHIKTFERRIQCPSCVKWNKLQRTLKLKSRIHLILNGRFQLSILNVRVCVIFFPLHI